MKRLEDELRFLPIFSFPKTRHCASLSNAFGSNAPITFSPRSIHLRVSEICRYNCYSWRSERRDGGMASRVDHENDYLFKIVLIMTLVWANLTFSLDLPGMSSAWSPNPSSESSSPPELSRQVRLLSLILMDESLHFAPLVLNWIHVMILVSWSGLYEYDHDASKARELEVAIRMKTNIQNTVNKFLQANPAGVLKLYFGISDLDSEQKDSEQFKGFGKEVLFNQANWVLLAVQPRKSFKFKSDSFGKMQMGFDWEAIYLFAFFSFMCPKSFQVLIRTSKRLISSALVVQNVNITLIVEVKFTSQDSYDNAYFSLKTLSAELPQSVIEALHNEVIAHKFSLGQTITLEELRISFQLVPSIECKRAPNILELILCCRL
ncbi:hypothetical protein DVH24_021613 [Malus domestica]|uniref:Uncharacterized protein n=1 Tax=Malus domestica TaxID=3750 RepID=A0A498K3H1_MALDO|nr:hypothetical protein DVH24_021613 [Malus domestica]